MKLEEATAVLRPRNAWEAVDLGCALARRHWGPLVHGWLTVALPLWTVIAIVFHQHPGWAMFVLWWTKPVLTRQPIYFLSRALFGTPPCRKAFWSDWRGSLWRGLPAGLTFKRLSFQRSFRLPVLMLEGQTGRACTRRVSVLSAHGGGNAAWLSFISLKLELVVTLGLMLWMDSFMTEGLGEWLTLGAPDMIPAWYLWAINGFYAIAIALIEPMYAAAGFALYINSRTHLEGWDIEVAFRRMTARLTPVASAAAIVFLTVLFLNGNAGAAPSGNPNAVMDEVLGGADFEVQKRKVPVADLTDSGDWNPETSGVSFPGYLIIAAVVVAAAWLLWKNRMALRRGAGRKSAPVSGPRVVMGMDLAPESLPDDIPHAAWREYESGRPLEALRLLYRGALAWLVSQTSLPVHGSDTEGDCLRHSRQLNDAARVSFFETLTKAWINCAYAGVPPGAAPMRNLCDAWPFSLRRQDSTLPGRGAAVALLLVSFSAVLLQGCGGAKIKYEEKTVGYKGAARANPWLAAGQMLDRLGVLSETSHGPGEMPETDTVLVVAAESIASRGMADEFLKWAARGGHLIAACAGADRIRNDWLEPAVDKPAENGPLMEALGVAFVPRDGDGSYGVGFGDGTERRLEFDEKVALDVRSRTPDIIAGSPGHAVLASFPYRTGRITLIASATPFRNRWIGDADHASIFYELTNLEPSDSVLFLLTSRISFWHLLVEHAWMPLVATAMLVALWLWRHLPRFGPPIPPDDSRLRQFGAQLDESGAFLDERAGRSTLLSAARRSVVRAATQRGLNPAAPDFAEHLAARTGLRSAEISQALHDESGKSDVVALAGTLQKLQQSLGMEM